ncbi:MAG TPA: HTTM domain-containing protein [Bdellovibrio sp.]
MTCFVFFLASLFLGFFSRVACLIAGVVILSVRFFTAKGDFFYFFQHHQTTVLGLICIILYFTPSDAYFSIDRRFRKVDLFNYPSAILMFRALVSSIYFYAAIDKISWLGKEHLLALLTQHVWGSLNVPSWAPTMCFVLTLLSILSEFLFSLIAWSPKWSFKALPFVILFHLASWLLLPISSFFFVTVLLWAWLLPPEKLKTF